MAEKGKEKVCLLFSSYFVCLSVDRELCGSLKFISCGAFDTLFFCSLLVLFIIMFCICGIILFCMDF